jgi:hypothetical protein
VGCAGGVPENQYVLKIGHMPLVLLPARVSAPKDYPRAQLAAAARPATSTAVFLMFCHLSRAAMSACSPAESRTSLASRDALLAITDCAGCAGCAATLTALGTEAVLYWRRRRSLKRS